MNFNELLTIANKEVFLKYCFDPFYIKLLEIYFEYFELYCGLNIEQNEGNFYNSLYSLSSYSPDKRLLLRKNKGSFASTSKVAKDLGVTIEYDTIQPFVIGESPLTSESYLSTNKFCKVIYTITDYTDEVKLAEFKEYFYTHVKAAGIQTQLIIS